LPLLNCLSFERIDVIILIESIPSRSVSKHFIPQEKTWPSACWPNNYTDWHLPRSAMRSNTTSIIPETWERHKYNGGKQEAGNLYLLLHYCLSLTWALWLQNCEINRRLAFHDIGSYQKALEPHRDKQPGNYKIESHEISLISSSYLNDLCLHLLDT